MELTIGIVNNMPLAARRSTDRQFTELLTQAAGDDFHITLRWFRLSGAKPDFYETLDDLWASKLDGLIVTGAEPQALKLPDEPFWSALTQTIDWARTNTVSTIWSCLAVHGAVLHLDGIERFRQPEKTFGLYSAWFLAKHPMLDDFPTTGWVVPHSRWHDLPREALERYGYQIMAMADEAGVDMFAKQFDNSLFWFIQSHPEYDRHALMREFRRDVGRFAVKIDDRPPPLPKHYFRHAHDEQALIANRNNPTFQTAMLDEVDVAYNWLPDAVQLYRNWLGYLQHRNALMPLGSLV